MSDTSAHPVYKMLDNLTDTMSWAELAKELDKYATATDEADLSSGGETIEMKDLMRSLVDKHRDSGEKN